MKPGESAVVRARNIGGLLRGNDLGGAMEFIERELCNFFTKGCVRKNSINQRNPSLCFHCKYFDEVNLVCRWTGLNLEEEP